MLTVTRGELDDAGVAKQADLLTPQQRGERELAKQGITGLVSRANESKTGHDEIQKICLQRKVSAVNFQLSLL